MLASFVRAIVARDDGIRAVLAGNLDACEEWTLGADRLLKAGPEQARCDPQGAAA